MEASQEGLRIEAASSCTPLHRHGDRTGEEVGSLGHVSLWLKGSKGQAPHSTYRRYDGKRIGSPEGGRKSDRRRNADVHSTLPAFLFWVGLYRPEEAEMGCDRLARNGCYTQALSLALLTCYLALLPTVTP